MGAAINMYAKLKTILAALAKTIISQFCAGSKYPLS